MTYDEWIGTPEGSMALVVAKGCDTFAQADKVLRVAFEAGQRSPRPTPAPFEGSPTLDRHGNLTGV